MVSLTMLTSAVALGLLASPHCASMCGCGLARPWLGQPLMFHSARILGYTVAGTVAGSMSAQLLGMAAQSAPVLQAFNAMLMAVLLFSALFLLWRGQGLTTLVTDKVVFVPFLQRTSSDPALVMSTRSPSKHPVSKRHTFLVGFMWPLLPCGVLWSALMLAYLSGSALQGGLLMLLFAIFSTVAVQVAGRLQQQLKKVLPEATVNRGCGFVVLVGLGLMLARQLNWISTPGFMQGLPLCW